jgi:hypothetical protein
VSLRIVISSVESGAWIGECLILWGFFTVGGNSSVTERVGDADSCVGDDA